MTSIPERYDRMAARYERWWAPVLAPRARGLADALAPLVADLPDAHVLEIGTGSGTLAFELLRRYPSVRVTASDASAGMLAEARQQARQQLERAATRRLTFKRADAASLPFQAGAFDAVVSSFVFQLVPDRFAALRESRRVLRPGGLFAVLTWLSREDPFEPDEVLEDAIDELELDLDDEPDDRRSGNFPSVEAAAAQVRRAGFRDVHAAAAPLVHRYDPATYVTFLEEYAERGLFEGLGEGDRTALRDATTRRLARLRAEDFVWRMDVVTVTGRRNR